ncbi:S1 RNA-binding domain-containing protein [Streptomyces sp. NPDC048172]|uniref:S1 RNA-binding domain-containing protein n=1 Tax=Streptomyces sp. NPDC048172 TaxID=3365505 RepID=UPI003720104E
MAPVPRGVRAGDAVDGTVVAAVPMGTFVRLAPGVEGLLPGERLTPGDTVRVTVAELDEERRRIALTSAGPSSPPVSPVRWAGRRPR